MLTRRFILAAAAATAAAAALPASAATALVEASPPRTWYAILWDENAVMVSAGSPEDAILNWLETHTGRRSCATGQADDDCDCEFCWSRAQIIDAYHDPSLDGHEEVTDLDYFNAGFGVCCQGCGEPYAYKDNGGSIIDGSIFCDECATEERKRAEIEAELAAEDAADAARGLVTRAIGTVMREEMSHG